MVLLKFLDCGTVHGHFSPSVSLRSLLHLSLLASPLFHFAQACLPMKSLHAQSHLSICFSEKRGWRTLPSPSKHLVLPCSPSGPHDTGEDGGPHFKRGLRGHGKFTNQICAALACWPYVLGRNAHVVAFVWGEVEGLSHDGGPLSLCSRPCDS